MEQPGGVAAKRRVLVDALTMCLERSKVGEHVNSDTLRTVLTSAMAEMWREGELRLEVVWKILTQQPGVSAKEVAPPLLLIKAYEEELGVAVRLPQALVAVPRSEQVRLRDELKITKDDFTKVLGELQTIAKAEQDQKQQVDRADKEKEKEKPAPAPIAAPTPGKKPAKKPMSKAVAAALMGVALAICASSLFFTMRSNAEPADFSDVAAMLKIEGGERNADSWSGTITDSRWDKIPVEERKRLAAQVFEHESGKGVKVLTLKDPSGETRVTATSLGGITTVMAH